jgi:hypothetical protein
MLTMSSAEFGRHAGLAEERVAHDEKRSGRVLRECVRGVVHAWVLRHLVYKG